jgi:two-component system OmpR family sensor kinase
MVNGLMERDGRNLEPISQQGVPEELEPVVRNVNRLMQRLKAALEQERSFSANCAHELRNPLAAATAQAELLVDAGNKDDAAPLLAGLRELGHKLERLLQLSRAEAGISMTRETIDLVATSRFIVDNYKRNSPEGERVRFVPGPMAIQLIALDNNALGILLRNLLDNAAKHSPQASPIDVIIERGATLRVRNDSAVIAPDILGKLNRQFVRANHAITGDGLGLYIVSQIVSKADGDLELQSPASGKIDGFEVVIRFSPAKEAAAQSTQIGKRPLRDGTS